MQKGINGNIHIFNAATRNLNTAHILPPNLSNHTKRPLVYPHVFSACHDVPIIHSKHTIDAFLALDNKKKHPHAISKAENR